MADEDDALFKAFLESEEQGKWSSQVLGVIDRTSLLFAKEYYDCLEMETPICFLCKSQPMEFRNFPCGCSLWCFDCSKWAYKKIEKEHQKVSNQRFGERVVFNLGRSLQAKVSSIIVAGRWSWPRGRNRVVAEISSNTAASLVPNIICEDKVIWTLTPSGVFSAKSAWSALRTRAPEIDWCTMVWYQKLVPRWAFILWVAILGRLATRDRLCTWGVTSEDSCVLCHGEVESHAHLFFGCSYAIRVWRVVKVKCGYTFPSTDLASELQWGVLHCKGDSMRKILYKLGLAASVYYIWRERNSRIFKGRPTEPSVLIQTIVEDVKASVCSWRKVPCSAENLSIGLDWGIPHWVFQ